MNLSRRRFLWGSAAAVVAATTVSPAKVITDLITPAFQPVPAWCPPGFLPCDGRVLSKTMYSDLFRMIGFYYGSDNPAEFRLPEFAPGPNVSHVVCAEPGYDLIPVGAILQVLRPVAEI